MGTHSRGGPVFSAKGSVDLSRAKIEIGLSCEGGIFSNPSQPGVEASGTALSASGLETGGDVLLRGDFHAEGRGDTLRSEDWRERGLRWGIVRQSGGGGLSSERPRAECLGCPYRGKRVCAGGRHEARGSPVAKGAIKPVRSDDR